MKPVTAKDQKTGKQSWQPSLLKLCLESQQCSNEDNRLIIMKKSHVNGMKLDHESMVKTTGKKKNWRADKKSLMTLKFCSG